MIAMNNRYRPDTMALRPFAQGGELGDIFLTRGAWLNRKMRVVRPTWRHRKATAGGGAMMDLGVQTLDLCLWMQGFPEVASVVTHMHYPDGMEVEDTAGILVRLKNGAGHLADRELEPGRRAGPPLHAHARHPRVRRHLAAGRVQGSRDRPDHRRHADRRRSAARTSTRRRTARN
jgi:predicted dehydrogenase